MCLVSIKILIIYFLISLHFGCSESDDTDTQLDQIDSYTGQIILPAGSSVDVSSLNVTSSTSVGQNNQGIVEVEELDDYSALYVTNQNDEVMLMNYKYPSNPDGNINATSTALGLIMMTPSLVFLSDEGKQNLINTLLPNAEFQTLVAEIEQNLVDNRSLFDPTNTSLMQALTDLFQTISQRSTSNSDSAPVNVFPSGRNFVFNAGAGSVPNVFNTVIGVYKDEQRIEKIVVKGVQIVPNSVSDILSGNGSTFDDPIDYTYTIEGDGEFTFKYRTGKPGFGDGSIEHDEAFYENLSQFSMNLLQTFLPTLSSDSEPSTLSSCLVNVFNNTYNTISSISNISSNSNAGIGTILYTVNEILLNNVNSLLNSCTNVTAQQGWFSSFMNQWNFVNTAFNVISNGANTTIFATQWGLSNAVYDECYAANGNDVEECSGCGDITSFTDPRDGQVYPVVQIGDQCWFAKNLNYNTGNSWCYDDDPANCDTYGRLYDLQTALTACPDGWHLPSDEEWMQLIDFLGGFDLAGGKMKSTSSLWNAPNTEATNSSGFSGLPGALRNWNGSSGSSTLGDGGFWWSSTEVGTGGAQSFILYNNEGAVTKFWLEQTFGLSCRCLRD